MWAGVNGIVLINQIAIRSEKAHEVARCKQPQRDFTLLKQPMTDILVKNRSNHLEELLQVCKRWKRQAILTKHPSDGDLFNTQQARKQEWV